MILYLNSVRFPILKIPSYNAITWVSEPIDLGKIAKERKNHNEYIIRFFPANSQDKQRTLVCYEKYMSTHLTHLFN